MLNFFLFVDDYKYGWYKFKLMQAKSNFTKLSFRIENAMVSAFLRQHQHIMSECFISLWWIIIKTGIAHKHSETNRAEPEYRKQPPQQHRTQLPITAAAAAYPLDKRELIDISFTVTCNLRHTPFVCWFVYLCVCKCKWCKM